MRDLQLESNVSLGKHGQLIWSVDLTKGLHFMIRKHGRCFVYCHSSVINLEEDDVM